MGFALKSYDVIVLGGGAAGLMCALTAGQQGCRVLVLEVSNKLGKKILMSGGGRCNFTNLEIGADHYLCENPHFVKSALSQYTQWDFIDLVESYEIPYHEKHSGQLFCDNSAKDILQMLINECAQHQIQFNLNCTLAVEKLRMQPNSFSVSTNQGDFCSHCLVVATGGLSIPTLGGATGLGYQLAKQAGLSVSKTEASLVPLTLSGKWHEFAKALSGVSIPVIASVLEPEKGFSENMLFTHRGLSGPAILQLSNYWHSGSAIMVDLLPGITIFERLLAQKAQAHPQTLSTALAQHWPKSLVNAFIALEWSDIKSRPLQEIKSSELKRIAEQLHQWQITPSGTEGYRTAEVTRGGVKVDLISSKTLEVKSAPGLFMIGEVLDVTGHLGGYNFQWAWSSGYVAGMQVAG